MRRFVALGTSVALAMHVACERSRRFFRWLAKVLTSRRESAGGHAAVESERASKAAWCAADIIGCPQRPKRARQPAPKTPHIARTQGVAGACWVPRGCRRLSGRSGTCWCRGHMAPPERRGPPESACRWIPMGSPESMRSQPLVGSQVQKAGSPGPKGYVAGTHTDSNDLSMRNHPENMFPCRAAGVARKRSTLRRTGRQTELANLLEKGWKDTRASILGAIPTSGLANRIILPISYFGPKPTSFDQIWSMSARPTLSK